MYEAQKLEFERLMVKSELEPTPGGWFLATTGRFSHLPAFLPSAVRGRCCLFSPAFISAGEPSNYPVLVIAHVYRVPTLWIDAALRGFDGEHVNGTLALDMADKEEGETYRDGYAWGKAMREKYVRKGGQGRQSNE